MGTLCLNAALVLATPLARARDLRVHARCGTGPLAVRPGDALKTAARAVTAARDGAGPRPLAVWPGGALKMVAASAGPGPLYAGWGEGLAE